MKAIDVDCRSCAAKAGEKCKLIPVVDVMNASGFHGARSRSAHYATLGERRVKAANNRKIDAAIKAARRK